MKRIKSLSLMYNMNSLKSLTGGREGAREGGREGARKGGREGEREGEQRGKGDLDIALFYSFPNSE